MNTKRKAELQRKLALAPVPRPPADLLDRIKNDIPEHLRPEAGRRASRSVAFNLRIAASILVAISAVIAAVYLMTPEKQLSRLAASRPAPMARTLEDKAATANDQVEVEITQSMPAERPVLQIADATSAPSYDYERRIQREEAPAPASVIAQTAPAGAVARDIDAQPEPQPAPVPLPPPAAAPPAAVDSIAVRAAAPALPKTEDRERAAGTRLAAPSASFILEAHAAERDEARPGQVFGISVDPDVFHRIKATLERNERPSATAVDLEALINYFAGAPAKPPRSGVRMEVEGSPAPVGGNTHRGFLRFTIDTAAADSQLPVGAEAQLTIDMNGKVVERADAIGDSTTLTSERALMHGMSVTGLYELTLRPNLRALDRIATIRLTYKRAADGKSQTIEKAVYARDFARPWTRASRRHRLASLGAVWGESLKVSGPAPEVLRRAEELASQEPADARARELATAATASSKLNGF